MAAPKFQYLENKEDTSSYQTHTRERDEGRLIFTMVLRPSHVPNQKQLTYHLLDRKIGRSFTLSLPSFSGNRYDQFYDLMKEDDFHVRFDNSGDGGVIAVLTSSDNRNDWVLNEVRGDQEKTNFELLRRIEVLEANAVNSHLYWTSEWIPVQSNSDNLLRILHPLQCIPKILSIHFKANLDDDSVIIMSRDTKYCNGRGYNSAMLCGAVRITSTAVEIGLYSGGNVGQWWDSNKWHTYKTGFYQITLSKTQ